MGGVYGLEVSYTLDAGGKERRIAERLKHRLPQCSNCDFTGDIQNTASLARGIVSLPLTSTSFQDWQVFPQA